MTRPGGVLAGILLTILSGLLLATMDTFGKYLTGELPVLEIVWARYFFHTILMTAWLLVVGVLAPLGIVPPEALAYERAHRLASHPVGRLVLLGILALPLWKGAHHVRHFFIDRGHAAHDGTIGGIAYLVATLGSLAALVAVIRL